MKKGIIYGRVSTDKQDYARQVNELAEYAKRNEIEIIETFTDIQSGKVKAKDRKASKGMFNFIESNVVDIVLVSEISRLGRSAIDVQKNIDNIVFNLGKNLYIHQQGMTARTRTGKVNSTFKLITDVLANVAQMEREQISDRVKSGLAEAKRKGKILGRPTGTTKEAKDILTEYKKVVKKLNEGISIREIGKICNVSPATVQKVKKAIKLVKSGNKETVAPKT